MKKKFKLFIKEIDVLLTTLVLLLNKNIIIRLYGELGNATMVTAYTTFYKR